MVGLAILIFLAPAFAQTSDEDVPSFERAASSQMGTGQVPAAGGAAAASRRRDQEVPGNANAFSAAAGDAYFAAGDAYAAAGGAAAAHGHRRREKGGHVDTNSHHQAPGFEPSPHTLADILMPGGGQFGRDYPNRIDYGRHVDPLSMVDNHAHGHPIEGAYSFRNPSDAKPYGRPLDQRPLGNPSDSRHYGHSSLVEQMPFGSSFESMPYSGSFVDMRPNGGYQECPQKCDLKAWPRCQCLSPATYSDDGRGNCNVGAMNTDLQVWCYVDPSVGNPLMVCPDSRPSDSKPGYFWSRFACITETVE